MLYIKHYKSPVGNAKKTLAKSVDVNSIDKFLGASVKNKIRKLWKNKKIYAWDFGLRATSHLHDGDSVAIVTAAKAYTGQCIAIIDDSTGSMGDALGWARQFSQPWQHPALLIDVKEYALSKTQKEQFAALLRHTTQVQSGFYILEDGSAFTSLFALKNVSEGQYVITKRGDDHRATPLVVREQENEGGAREEHLYYGFVEELDNKISVLKARADHSERDHESLVEHLFISLGFGSHAVKFQSGRIDVLVEVGTAPVFVIEVKKSWELNRFDKKVLKQVFGYALEVGARYPIITNGDYYAVYDQRKGVSYEDMFLFDFSLSALNSRGITNISTLKKIGLATLNG